MFDSPCIEIVDEAMWCLGNIAADKENYRNDLLRLDGFNRALRVSERAPMATREKIVWLIKNVVITKPIPPYSQIKEAFPFLVENLRLYPNSIETKDTLWAISCLTQSGKPSQVSCFFD